MKIVIAGGTGFLGLPLTTDLLASGHTVVVLTRREQARVPAGAKAVVWEHAKTRPTWSREIDGADVVINLAGEPIGEHRWSAAEKQRIEDSRISATRHLVAAILDAKQPPAVLVSGSAVGFYGPCGDEFVTEETGAGNDFLAGVCRRWEAQAVEASSARTRVVCVRTGLVLDRDGGAMARMLPPFRMGLGGRAGTGRQYWPWIHRTDWIKLIRFAIDTSDVAGPMNATAPEPVTNQVFAKELGKALGRPSFVPASRLALRLVLGEMADALLLSGQRAVPAKADRFGYRFTYEKLPQALAALFSQGKTLSGPATPQATEAPAPTKPAPTKK